MRISDYLGFGFCFAWGLWGLAFPRSFIALQVWFHRGRIKRWKPITVRIGGALWIVLVLAVLIDFLLRESR